MEHEMSKSSNGNVSKTAWEKAAEDFNAGKTGQAWFYQGDDLSLILKGHCIEAASLSDDSMATLVLDGDLMVQVYAGGYLADTSVRLSRVARRTGEITAVGQAVFEDEGRRRPQVFAWTTDEYGPEELEILFEAFDVDGRAVNTGRMFFGVAFRSPSAAAHAVGADR